MDEVKMALDALTEQKPWIGYWLNWMLIINLLSVLFVWKYKAARWVLAAFVVAMIIGNVIGITTKNIHLIGIAHLIAWIPLSIYLIRSQLRSPSFTLKSPYFVWIVLLVITIIISIVFDIRDIALVIMGQK